MISSKLIFSKCANENEFLKTLSLFNGNSFGIHFINIKELIERIANSCGFSNKRELISGDKINLIIYDLIKDNKDFPITDFSDIKQIKSAMDKYRSIFPGEYRPINSSMGETLLLPLVQKYEEYLSNNKLCDQISLIKDLLKVAGFCIDEIYLTKQDFYSPIELELIKKVAKKINYDFDVYSLLIEDEERSLPIGSASYGESNEIRDVLSTILNSSLDDKINFVDVNVYLANSKNYLTEFVSLCKQYNIPVNFRLGRYVKDSNAFRLIYFLLHFNEKYLFSVEGYKALFSFNGFKKKEDYLEYYPFLADILGHLKIGYDSTSNEIRYNNFLKSNYKDKVYKQFAKKYISQVKDDKIFNADEFTNLLKEFISVFSKGFKEVFLKFFYDTSDSYEIACKEVIVNSIDSSNTIKNENIRNTFIDSVGGSLINQEENNENAINVFALENINSSIRRHNFIIGLSSKYFPGDNKESFLLSDEAISSLTNVPYTKKDQIKKRLDDFSSFKDTLSKINSKFYFSYSFYSLNDVKSVNPSSVFYDSFSEKEINYFKKNKSLVNDYFDKNEMYIKDILANINIICFDIEQNKKPISFDFDNLSFSPTAIEKYFECPFAFYVEYILGYSFEDPYDISIPLNALDFGNLFHESIQILKKQPSISKDAFVAYGMDLLNNYYFYNVPIVEHSKIDNDFKKSLTNAYDYISANNIVIIETERWIEDSFKINNKKMKLGGKYDALGTINGENVLLDYKTGKSIKHEENNSKTGIQWLIYAYLLNKQGVKVNEGCYLYVRKGIDIKMNYPLLEDEVKDLLNTFATRLLNGDFAATKNKEPCKYCKYNKICRRETEEDD